MDLPCKKFNEQGWVYASKVGEAFVLISTHSSFNSIFVLSLSNKRYSFIFFRNKQPIDIRDVPDSDFAG